VVVAFAGGIEVVVVFEGGFGSAIEGGSVEREHGLLPFLEQRHSVGIEG
jgi:hypothetical protein